jgi:hypothetical protein
MIVAKTVTNAPVSDVVKELLDHERTIENTPDTLHIFWADVKKAYPELENHLKPLFKGKDRLPVADLKELMNKVPQETAKFWLSQTSWDSHLQRDLGMAHPQIIFQFNIGKQLVADIHKDPLLRSFWNAYTELTVNNPLHPNHSQTVAWARVYPMADKYVIEEVQSDLFGGSVRLRDVSTTDISDIMKDYSAEEKKKIEEFFHKHFVDWDKKLVASIIAHARKNGVKDIWMFDEDVKKKHLKSESKLDRFYKVLPRDMGFKRSTLNVDDMSFGGWHRVVATSGFVDALQTKYSRPLVDTLLAKYVPR